MPDHDVVTKAVARTRPSPPALPVTVTVPAGQAGIPVPRSFLGLSVEYWGLAHFERHAALFDSVLSLIRPPGDGPAILRVGGDSADRTFWEPDVRSLPKWAFGLTPNWWRELRSVVQRTGVRVIIDLNLVTGSAPMAAQWARTAEAVLPKGSIVGFEVGNEPDIYSNRYWAKAISPPGRLDFDAIPRRLSTLRYLEQFEAYASAISQVAPNVPLMGPALANPVRDVSWVSTLLDGPHNGLAVVTVHRYPYSACMGKSSTSYPTIARVLSEKASAGLARAVAPAVRLAHRAGLPVHVTELNSVTCGGRRGVSDTFATALWAPDALFELMRAGVDGANIHVRENASNAAFDIAAHRLWARPLLYGLATFARTLGPGAHLVDAHVRTSPALDLKAWAVRLRGGILHVLLIDKSRYRARVNLRVPNAAGPASVQRLVAPSVRAPWAVTLDGQSIAADGRWKGPRRTEAVASSWRGYEIVVPRYSAALVSLDVHRNSPAPVQGGRVLVGARADRRTVQLAASRTRGVLTAGVSHS